MFLAFKKKGFQVLGLIILSTVLHYYYLVEFHSELMNTGRMITLYNIAANLVDDKGFFISYDFVREASRIVYEKGKNLDYFMLEEIIDVSNKYNKPRIVGGFGYSYLLYLFWIHTPEKSYIYVQIFQVIVDILIVLLIYRIGETINRGSGFIAGLLYLTSYPVLFFSVLPNKEIFTIWVTIIACYLFIRFLSTEANKYLLIISLLLSCGLFIRMSFFMVVAGFILFLFLYRGSGSAVRGVFFFLIPFVVLFVIPAAIIHYEYMGSYNFMAIPSAWNLWAGLGEYPNEYGFVCSDEFVFEHLAEIGIKPEPSLAMAVALRKEAMSVIIRDPMFYIYTVLRRCFDIFFYRGNVYPFPVQRLYRINECRLPEILEGRACRGLDILLVKIFIVFYGKLLNIIFIIGITYNYIFVKNQYIFLLFFIWASKILPHILTHIEARYVAEIIWPQFLVTAWIISRVIFRDNIVATG